MALKPESRARRRGPSQSPQPPGTPNRRNWLLENGLSFIAKDYDRSSDLQNMEHDAFYALDSIFRLAIAAESQFLEMMRIKIKAATVIGGNGQIEDLEFALELIDDHQHAIRETLATVKMGGHPDWPRATGKPREAAESARNQLARDLEHLLDLSRGLASRCTEGISIMMNDAMFRQAQMATNQTHATIRISILAFFFAPLSVTTSLFSMQVREIQDGHLSIWVWFLTSAMLVALAFVFWMWDVPLATRRMLRGVYGYVFRRMLIF